MIYLIIGISICLIVFLIRLWMMKKQLHLLTKQLTKYNQGKSEMKLDISLSNQHIEALAVEINRLIDSKEMESANTYRVEQELKQAIAGMSHDLRTPLTSIVGYMQLLENKQLAAEKRDEYMAIVKRRSARLQQLLHDFFALSIVDSEDYVVELEARSINSLVEEVLLSYYDVFQRGNIQPTVEMLNEKLTIIIDENACRRVLENIFENSIQHGSGDVRVRLERQDGLAYLEIKNKLKEHKNIQVDKLFERFYTTDRARRDSKGLGLTIAKKLMKRMKGELTATVVGEEFIVTCKWKLVD